METHILVNIGTCNGSLPDSTKPLPEPIVTYDQNFFCGIHLILGVIS